MARIKVDKLLDAWRNEITAALGDTMRQFGINAGVSDHALSERFQSALKMKLGTWKRVKDGVVDVDD